MLIVFLVLAIGGAGELNMNLIKHNKQVHIHMYLEFISVEPVMCI